MDLNTILIILLILLILGIIFYFFLRGGRPTQDRVTVTGKIIYPTLTAALNVNRVNCDGTFTGELEVVGAYNFANGGNDRGIQFNVVAHDKKNTKAFIQEKAPYVLTYNKNVVKLIVQGNLEDLCQDGTFAMRIFDVKDNQTLKAVTGIDVISNSATVMSRGVTVTKPIKVTQSSEKDFQITFTLKCCSGGRFLSANPSNFTNVASGTLVYQGNGTLNCSSTGAPLEKQIIVDGKKEDETKKATVSFKVIDNATNETVCNIGTAEIGLA